MSRGRILVVEDDESLRRVTQVQLERCGYQTAVAADAAQAIQILDKEPWNLVIADLNLPGPSGLDLLKRIRSDYPDTTVVMVTAFATIETAVEAMRSGAYDYIAKPVHPDELRALVNRVLERHRLIEEVRVLRTTLDQKYGFENMIGRSSALLQVLDSAARVAQSDAIVLILGETGTGKELLAKAIHFNSLRRERPFVTINCGAIPGELLESELFGHVKGSFTGAINHKKGKVEVADGGTVFLDEIGEMPLDLQVKVLRLLQEREIEKVGATNLITVDVRIIAATHRDLQTLAEEGKFRRDLYYRLAVVPLALPPLRDRIGDIAQLVHHFFKRSKLKHGRPELQLPMSLMPYFLSYNWPGNVREVENVIERLVLLSRSEEVLVTDLPETIRYGYAVAKAPKILPGEGGAGLNAVERELIVQALNQSDWNQTKAARSLGISRKTLRYRMAKHGIVKDGVEPDPNVKTSVQKG